MWKIQHPEGQREINELHVPVDRPVRLTMASEDVIHSFFIPAFRVKRDVVPGRFTQLWFQATAVGEYHLFCAEYCGTKHSEMVGRVVVMEPVDYQNWLGGVMPAETPVATGERLFDELGCKSCHRADTGQRGPSLEGLFMQTVPLTNGETVIADQDYLRQSILAPAAKLRVGYGYLMPTFRGQVSEEQLLALIAYIKSLAGPGNRS
jgi:cytochrome c oxidase subunit 2